MNTPMNATPRSTASVPTARLVVIGLVIWFAVTLLFRWVGQFVLVPGDTARTVFTLLAAIPLMYVVMNLVLPALGLEGRTRPLGAVLVLAPGLMLDGLLSITFFATVFPNMDPAAAGSFGALMCVGYGMGFLTSALPGWNRSKESKNA
jgi:hypothetical protein